MMAISCSNCRYRRRSARHHTPDCPRLQAPGEFSSSPHYFFSGPRTSLWTVARSTAVSLKDMGKLRPLYQASN